MLPMHKVEMKKKKSPNNLLTQLRHQIRKIRIALIKRAFKYSEIKMIPLSIPKIQLIRLLLQLINSRSHKIQRSTPQRKILLAQPAIDNLRRLRIMINRRALL